MHADLTNFFNRILHPQLRNDCLLVGCFPLSLLLLMNDANYPWFVLVPTREDITEIYQLKETDQQQLLRESSSLAHHLHVAFRADKLNIAALGNVVPQLHVHHVVRYKNDPAWPAPVWGKVPPNPYADETISQIIADLQPLADAQFSFV